MNGKQVAVYETMKYFISNKYYATKGEVQEVLKSFNITQDITPEQYSELTLLNKSVYYPIVEDEPVTLEEPVTEDIDAPLPKKRQRVKRVI